MVTGRPGCWVMDCLSAGIFQGNAGEEGFCEVRPVNIDKVGKYNS